MSTTMALTSSAGQQHMAASATWSRGDDQCCLTAWSPLPTQCSEHSTQRSDIDPLASSGCCSKL